MSGYKIKSNRTTNHIDGVDERTKGSALNYAVSPCSVLSRSVNLLSSKTYSSLREVLAAARIAGQRKLCRNCEKAALAALEAGTSSDETETIMTKSTTPDTDQIISDVHSKVDAIGAADSEDALTALAEEAETLIRTLPTSKRTALRKTVKDAIAVRDKALVPQPEAPASAEATAADSLDPADYPGVPEVMAQGVAKVREGVELGMKLTTAGEEMARIMLNMRSLVPNPDTGLPDIMAQRKTTKNFAAAIYAEARADVAETDVERLGAHNSLVKATQNKMSDVLVDWLSALDNPESADVVKALYPSVADAEKPSEAIRALYAERGVELPLKGRTEVMREYRARKALEAARKQREELVDSDEPDSGEALEKLDAKIRDLAADLGDAEELPTEAERSDSERAHESVEKLRRSVETTGKRMAKLDGAERTKLKAELYALIRDAASTFELDLSALTE